MKLISFIAATIYFVSVIILSIFFKKKYGIKYNLRIILSASILLLCTIMIDIYGDLSSFDSRSLSQSGKVSWLVLIVTSTYALGQFISWVIYSFAYKYNLIRIPRFLFNVITFLIVLSISLYTTSYLFGLDLSGLLVTSTVVSAIIGFSLQDTLGNFFAGLSLQMEAPFKIDDYVNLGGYEGTVVDQSWRSLTLLTGDDHRIILPNKAVAEERIVNYARPTTRQLYGFKIKLDYVYPPNKIISILNHCIDEVEGVERNESGKPYVWALEKKYIVYNVYYWIDNYSSRYRLESAVNTKIWYEFKRNDINFWVKKKRPKRPNPFYEGHTLEYKISKLKEQPWLESLEDEAILSLATQSKMKHYAVGERIVVQGNDGDSLYMIVTGTSSVLINDSTGGIIHVASKSKGDFFGEMSLLTGEPTSATIKADTEMDVLVLNKKSFKKIILNNESILPILLTALENNKSRLTEIMDLERNKKNNQGISAKQLLINRIRNYLIIP